MDDDPDERARKKRTKENKGFSVFDLILFYFLNSGGGGTTGNDGDDAYALRGSY